MKNVCKKIADVLSTIFGWGILVSLFAGGLTFFGYVAAICIGGGENGLGAQICTFLYKDVFPILVYIATSCVLLGLLVMYLSGEQALTVSKKDSHKHEGEM